MDRKIIEQAIGLILIEIGTRLREAVRITQVAEACVAAGSVGDGVRVSMDLEQIFYEASRLQDAASLLNRLSKD